MINQCLNHDFFGGFSICGSVTQGQSLQLRMPSIQRLLIEPLPVLPDAFRRNVRRMVQRSTVRLMTQDSNPVTQQQNPPERPLMGE